MPDEPANRVLLLTPEGRGAVAVLLVEGPDAAAIVGRHFLGSRGGPLEARGLGRIWHGRWDAAAGEEVVVCRRAQFEVEVHCHGGLAASRRIVADLTQSCCVELDWREWVRRRELSPIRADVRILLADARTERAAAILLDQLDGALDRELRCIAELVEAGSAEETAQRLERLLQLAPLGLHLVTPWRVVLAGPPNVGKSSLINALVGYRRSIVFDEPGTTRDVVTAVTALEGWPVELSDTAGLRASDDPLETAGVERAGKQLAAADCVVLVFDATAAWTEDCSQLAASLPAAIVVCNKADLLSAEKRGHSTFSVAAGDGARPEREKVECPLFCSALTGDGIDKLTREIVRRLVPHVPEAGEAVPFTPAQVAQIHMARDAISRGDLPSARSALSRIV